MASVTYRMPKDTVKEFSRTHQISSVVLKTKGYSREQRSWQVCMHQYSSCCTTRRHSQDSWSTRPRTCDWCVSTKKSLWERTETEKENRTEKDKPTEERVVESQICCHTFAFQVSFPSQSRGKGLKKICLIFPSQIQKFWCPSKSVKCISKNKYNKWSFENGLLSHGWGAVTVGDDVIIRHHVRGGWRHSEDVTLGEGDEVEKVLELFVYRKNRIRNPCFMLLTSSCCHALDCRSSSSILCGISGLTY